MINLTIRPRVYNINFLKAGKQKSKSRGASKSGRKSTKIDDLFFYLDGNPGFFVEIYKI